MAFFAVPYVIHFDDTMAYGSHHFVANFKFQCAGREHLLFGRRLYDRPEFKRAFDQVALLTHEAYSRNLAPAMLGDRLLVLTTFEEWSEVGFRFCFRVLRSDGTPISCGYQTILCASRETGEVTGFPEAFRACFAELNDIREPATERGFRDRVHRGGKFVRELFPEPLRALARKTLPAGADLPPPQMLAAPAALVLAPDSTAFLFPGQGSLDLTALGQLVRSLPELHDELRAACAGWRERMGSNAEGLLFASSSEAAEKALALAPDLDQLAIFLTGVLGARLLMRNGDQPGVLVGHSFGEIAALTVSGALTLSVGVEVVCQRVLALRKVGAEAGTLAAVSLGPSELRAELVAAELKNTALAGVNHAQQTVVSGPRRELELLAERLRARGKSLTLIASSYPFHHPSLQPAADAFAAALSALPMGTPAIPVYSPIGHSLYQGAQGEIAAALASHLVVPFDFPRAVSLLHQAGCRRFLECCARERLARIVRKILPEASGLVVESLAPALVAEQSPAFAPIAIVSLGCLLPGGARDPDAYWRNIRSGKSGIIDQRAGKSPELVADFFDASGAPDKSYSLLAGAVEQADLVAPEGFDAARFALYTRAQKELLIALTQCARGLPLRTPSRVMCLLGATADGCEEYDRALAVEGIDELLREAGQPGLAGRDRGADSEALAPFGSLCEVVSAVLGEGVRTLLLDAACASSLYTLALGSQRLQSGEADLVFAGGVFAPGPGNSCLFAQFRGLSATGSRPFDESADGVVFGDGAAVVALKRLQDAVRDGDTIHAVVRGVGLSSDGKSSSANVPRSEGQVLAMERCYQGAGLQPRTVQFVEAHGTATPAGDATELKSIARFFGDRSAAPLQIGSVKALLGHTGWAAGAASILKLCLALREKTLPRQHGFQRPQKELAALGAGYQVATSEAAWPANGNQPRRAAANGFGFGGTNGHVVLEEYLPAFHAAFASRPAPAAPAPEALVVVACEGLFAEAVDLSSIPLPASLRLLPDLAEDMDITQRLGLVLTDRVAQKLSAETFARLKPAIGVVLALQGKTPRGREAGLRVLAQGVLRELPVPPSTLELVRASCRQSGPYTLQGMMPNVTPGRIANVFDLKGPNFLLDAGQGSLDEALDTARALLAGSCEVVLAGAFEGKPRQAPGAAVLIALTTPQTAARLGLAVLGRLEARLPTERSVQWTAAALAQAIGAAHGGLVQLPPAAPASTVGYYQPALIARPLPDDAREDWWKKRVLFLAADLSLAREIDREAGARCADFRILLPASAANGSQPRSASFVELSEASSLELLEGFAPERIVSLARLASDAPEAQVIEDAAVGRGLLELQFLVARKLYARLERGEAALVSLCLSALSQEGALHPATGLFAGFAKSVGREVGAARVRAVALGSADVGAALDAAARELAHGLSVPAEAVWNGQERSVRLLVKSARSSAPGARLDKDSVVLATGGARGVTAVLVEALLRRYGCTVVLLGRSELTGAPPHVLSADAAQLDALEKEFYAAEHARDPSLRIAELRRRFGRQRAANELARTLAHLAGCGGKVVYRAADITQPDQVDAAIAQVQQRFGRLDLIVHGAGLQSSKKLDRRKLAELRENLDVKLLGLRNLHRACAQTFAAPVAFHVLTSAFSFFGNDGQADYGAANETLDRICAFASARRGKLECTSIAWLAWDGIGMTAGSEYQTLRGERTLHRLSAAEGQRLFLDVIDAPARSAINIQLSEHERTFYGIEIAPAPAATGSTRELRIDADSPWLNDHLVRGAPTLPGAWALDLMLGAALAGEGSARSVRIDGGRFSRFLRMKPGTSHTLRAQVRREGAGAQVRLVGDLVHHSGVVLGKDVLYAEASFSFDAAPAAAPRVDAPGEGSRAVQDPYCAPGADVQLRGRFDCLRKISLGASTRSAEVTLQLDEAGRSGQFLPAILLDAAWRLGAIHAEGQGQTVYAALDFERIWISLPHASDAAPRAERLSLSATHPRVEGETVRCERVEAVDEQGQVRLFVENGRGRRLQRTAAETP